MIGLIIVILIIVAVISFSGIVVVDVMGDMNNCKLWIQMNTVLLDEEFRDEQFFAETSYPETTNEGFFKIRFHADFLKCERWFDYDQVLDDITNERIGENYFDSINLDYFNDISFDDIMFWR